MKGSTIFSLDNTNGYSVTIEEGLTLNRPNFTSGNILIAGGVAALGPSDTAILPGSATSLQQLIGLAGGGGGALQAGFTFTVTADESDNVFEFQLDYLTRPRNSNLGIDPDTTGNLATGASFTVTPVNAIPEPSTAILGLAGSLFLLRRRR